MKNYLIVISGATATGKTALAIKIAQVLQCPILSCDSRQFYKELNIGTAKASPEELEMAEHYFINSLSIQDNYSVGDFEKDGLKLLKKLYTKHQFIILAGGSGLFIKALCEGLDQFPEVSDGTRQELIQLYENQGIGVLQEELQQKDPQYAKEVDLQNPHRLIRALGIIREQHKPFSSFRTGQKTQRSFHPIYINLTMDREVLYARINQRVDQMIEMGLLDEVKSLLPYQELNALQTVGYQELFPYFREEEPLHDAIELIKRNSRRYAKRQMTWFRREGHWKHFHPEEADKALSFIQWRKDFDIHFYQYKEQFSSDLEQFYQQYLPEEQVPHPQQYHLLLAYRSGRLLALAFAKKKKPKQVPSITELRFSPSYLKDEILADFLVHEMKFM